MSRPEEVAAPLVASSAPFPGSGRQTRNLADAGLVPLPLSREGSAHEGRLGLGNRERRVLYDPTLGLFMLRDLDEEEE